MPRPFIFAMLSAAFLTSVLAQAEPACLPPSLFSPEDGFHEQILDLGLIGKQPTLCLANGRAEAGLFGCWAIDPVSGTMSRQAVSFLPGHGQRGKTDAKGCIEGYCPVPSAGADELLLWAFSMDGTRAVILRGETLHIFDKAKKEQIGTVKIRSNDLPDNFSVGNEPVNLLYIGGTIYVVGSDAGPYIAVWAFTDDGQAQGVITKGGLSGNFSVYNGAVNIIDAAHIALADAGLQTMLILSAANGAKQTNKWITRPAGAACTAADMDLVNFEDASKLSQGCAKAVAKDFDPYFGFSPVRLPSGDFLAALGGKSVGSVAVLDGETLAEKRRFKLPRCRK